MYIKIILVILTILTFGLFCWSLFGSYKVIETGQECGLEMVAPCILYDYTREVDVLEKNRVYIASIAGLLFASSSVALFKFGIRGGGHKK